MQENVQVIRGQWHLLLLEQLLVGARHLRPFSTGEPAVCRGVQVVDGVQQLVSSLFQSTDMIRGVTLTRLCGSLASRW